MTVDDDEPIIDAEELALSLLATEAWMEDRGWDRNPLVLALQLDGPDDGDDPDGDEPDLDAWDEDEQDDDDLVYAVVGEGDPLAILDDLDASDQIALVVSREIADLRTVTAVTSDGYVVSVQRRRGDEPTVELGGDDALVEALHAALHPED